MSDASKHGKPALVAPYRRRRTGFLVTIATVAAMLATVAGTGASWSDAKAVTGSTFTAADLDLGDGGSGARSPFTFTRHLPAMVADGVPVTFQLPLHNGNTDLDAAVRYSVTGGIANGGASGFNLGEALVVTVEPADAVGTVLNSATSAIGVGNAATKLNFGNPAAGTQTGDQYVPAGAIKTLKVTVSRPVGSAGAYDGSDGDLTMNIIPEVAPQVTPAGVTATAGDAGAVVSWTQAEDVVSYAVTANVLATGVLAATVAGAGTANLTGLQNGTAYLVYVTATYPGGRQKSSAPVMVTPVRYVFKIVPADGVANDQDGAAVAISGDVAVLSAPNSVYVYERSGASWIFQSRLLPTPQTSNLFGRTVAIDDGTIVVGEIFGAGAVSRSGVVYVFARTETGWSQTARFFAPDGTTNSYFGGSLAIDDDTIVARSFASVYVFTRTGRTWAYSATIPNQSWGTYVQSVDVSEDTIVSSTDSGGKAVVYTKTDGVWAEQAVLTAMGGTGTDHFGAAASVDTGTILIGAPADANGPGAAYVFTGSGATWTQQARLTPSAGSKNNDQFGASLALDGNTALVGSSGGDGVVVGSGTAFVYMRSGTTWTQGPIIAALDGASADLFGGAVALDNGRAIVGSSLDDDKGLDSGSAYIYSTPVTPSVPVAPRVTTRAVTRDPITFTWTIPTYAVRYQSQVRVNGGAWSGTREHSSTARTSTTPGSPGDLVEIQVRAINTAGDASGWSSVASGVVPKPSPLATGASNQSVCELLSGKAYCWGLQSYGRLGNGVDANTNQTRPTAVVTSGALSGKTLKALTLSSRSACALDTEGKAYCWGLNSYHGELGDGTNTDSSVPVAVSTSGVLSGKVLASIAGGDESFCALDVGGKAYCWGDNGYGQLGINNSGVAQSNVPVAVDVSGVLAGKFLTKVAVNFSGACVIDTANILYCWGNAGSWPVVYDYPNPGLAPKIQNKGDLAGKLVTSIVAEAGPYSDWTAIDAEGHAYGWGTNSYGGRGVVGATSQITYPTRLNGGVFNTAFFDKASINMSTYALTDLGAYVHAIYSSAAAPMDMSGALAGKTIVDLSMGSSSYCLADSEATVYCWGQNSEGQTGIGSTVQMSSPTKILLPDEPDPTVVTVGGVTNTSATFSWTAAVVAASYSWESSINGGAWSAPASNTSRAATLTSAAGNTVAVRVRSVSAAGVMSAYSNVSSAVLPTAPLAPTASFVTQSFSTVTYAWAAVPGATSYEVDTVSGYGTWTGAHAPSASTSHVFGVMNMSTSSQFRVRGVNAAGERGPWSNIASH